MKKKGILIGLAGGTGSGKTSVARAITEQFGTPEVVLIEQDSYYADLAHLSLEKRAQTNFDHPNSLDFGLMKSHLDDLLSGKPVMIPSYDFKTHTRSKEYFRVEPHHIIVLEGIFALYDEEIRKMMDIKIYVDAEDDIRLLRRLTRDLKERGRTLESVIDQYCNTVRPMHLQFVEPTKRYADIIIPQGGHNTVAIDILQTKIKSLLNHVSENA